MKYLDKPLISVILPVYNVDKYLDKCIESIIKQTYKNLEIIIVNDGSSDGSSLICNKWGNFDNRIKIINKKNAGLGKARNTGLDHANGKFVMFVDSDDFIEGTAIEKLLDGLNNNDTIFCGYSLYYNDNRIIHKPMKYGGSIFFENDITRKILVEMMGSLPEEVDDICIPVSVWHGLYSMNIIKENNIRFVSEREFISEDMIFHIDYLSVAKSVSFIEDCLYYYRKNNENSLTTIYNPDRFIKEIILYNELENRLLKIMPREEYIIRLQRTFLGRVRSCIVRAVNESEQPIKEIKKICNDNLVKSILDYYPYNKCKIQLKIFNFCIHKKYIYLLILIIKFRYR